MLVRATGLDAEKASGAVSFIAHVRLYSNSFSVTIVQSTYANDAGNEIGALRAS